MSLTKGARLGAYEVVARIGAGGMGEVYRARDTKLHRDVALKILPEAFASDSDRLARFQREAQVLASLNHPNIGAIHGFEESVSIRALVLELVEGPTLADRIAQGAIPLDEALAIAKQIAEALEAAHEQGIIHRDLKPSNIKLRPDGTVKVLDFGLAKALEPASRGADVSHSPTITSPAMTRAGVILGTAAYMSPEQAKGQVVDKRVDIWAFGCVLHEMLTGQGAFDGKDVQEILGRVLMVEPDWMKLPRTTPPSIRRLLRRLLKKDPRERLADIRDARIEMEDVGTEAETTAASASAVRSQRKVWIVAAAALLIVAVFGIPAARRLLQDPTGPSPEMRLQIVTPSTAAPLEFALSPDGRYIAFIASGDGPQRLWLRPLDKTDAQPMPGTEGAALPFWSPDSRSLGFFAAGKLYRIELSGGLPHALTDIVLPRGASWSTDGSILFVGGGSAYNLVWRIPASGGDFVQVTRVEPGQNFHLFPEFLPNSRRFLFYSTGTPDASGIFLGSMDGSQPKRLTAADTAARFFSPDRIIFVRGRRLFAQRLDLDRGELTGDLFPIADSVGSGGNSWGGFSVSADSKVAYRTSTGERRQLTWFDRTGRLLGALGEPDADAPQYPELSPDGRRVSIQRTVQGNSDVWMMDLLRGALIRLTRDPGIETAPLWSSDATRIAFAQQAGSPFRLYLKASNGTDPANLLLDAENTFPQHWSKDGRFVLYLVSGPKTGSDLWALEMTGTERHPRIVTNMPFDERNGQFSPDGRWVAYQSNESGRFEIVVQSFSGEPKGKWQVSTGGGGQPRWRADGKELYFIAPDGKLMAAPLTMGSTVEAGTPVPLFQTRIVGGGVTAAVKQQYAVSTDGRFLINQPVEESTVAPITVILNWKPKS